MTIEDYLATMPFINIIGGSPLCTTPPIGCSISINGIRDAVAAAVNCGKKDERRVKSWSRVGRRSGMTATSRCIGSRRR